MVLWLQVAIKMFHFLLSSSITSIPKLLDWSSSSLHLFPYSKFNLRRKQFLHCVPSRKIAMHTRKYAFLTIKEWHLFPFFLLILGPLFMPPLLTHIIILSFLSRLNRTHPTKTNHLKRSTMKTISKMSQQNTHPMSPAYIEDVKGKK